MNPHASLPNIRAVYEELLSNEHAIPFLGIGFQMVAMLPQSLLDTVTGKHFNQSPKSQEKDRGLQSCYISQNLEMLSASLIMVSF